MIDINQMTLRIYKNYFISVIFIIVLTSLKSNVYSQNNDTIRNISLTYVPHIYIPISKENTVKSGYGLGIKPFSDSELINIFGITFTYFKGVKDNRPNITKINNYRYGLYASHGLYFGRTRSIGVEFGVGMNMLKTYLTNNLSEKTVETKYPISYFSELAITTPSNIKLLIGFSRIGRNNFVSIKVPFQGNRF